MPALIWVFGPAFLKASVNKLFCDTLIMINPRIMSLMITHVEQQALGDPDFYAWRGFLYAGLMLRKQLKT
jgi:hypothetical protein